MQRRCAAINYYIINEELARRAKEMNSYFDYKAGSATAEYRQSVDKAAQIAEAQKRKVDPIHHERIDRLLDVYARKLAENINKQNAIAARVPSILVAGGSNFPVRKKEKQNRADDTAMAEWREIQGILDKIRGTGKGGISADDPEAVQKLKAKLEALERDQESMKAVNAYYRKHKTLEGCPGLDPVQIEKLKASMARDWHPEPKPYPSFRLTNNNAMIRQTKKRIEELSQRAETEYEGWTFDGGRVEMNRAANRLQIIFDEKPETVKKTLTIEDSTATPTATTLGDLVKASINNDSELSEMFKATNTAGEITIESKGSGTGSAYIVGLSSDDLQVDEADAYVKAPKDTGKILSMAETVDSDPAAPTYEKIKSGDQITVNGKTYEFVKDPGKTVADGVTKVLIDDDATHGAEDTWKNLQKALAKDGVESELYRADGSTTVTGLRFTDTASKTETVKSGGLTLQIADTADSFM